MIARFTLTGLLAAGFVAQLGGAASAADLTIAMPTWASAQASANILKVAIKQEYGLDADAVEMGTLIAFNAMDTGSVDILPEVWQPNLDNLVEKYVKQSGTVTLSPKSVSAWQGLCANRAAAEQAGIKDISDLSDVKKTAALDTNGDGKGEMWIGAETWSSTAIERVRANSYGYAKNLDLLEMPEDVGMAAVDAADAVDKPIVFSCYAPNAVFKLHDIERITEPPYDAAKWKIVLPSEDPAWLSKSSATVGWDATTYRIAYASSLKERHPDVVKFLNRVDFSPIEAIDMNYALQVERVQPLAYAEQWVKDHADRVKGWAKQ